MSNYVVTENVTLKTELKKLRKDMIFSSEDMCQGDIERFIKKGYIKRLDIAADSPDYAGEIPPENENKAPMDNVPFYLTAEDYLSEKELKKLNKMELKEYAEHIKVHEIDSRMTAKQLLTAVNSFIEANVAEDEDEDGEGDKDGEGGDDDLDHEGTDGKENISE